MNKYEIIQELIFIPIRYIKENESAYSIVKNSNYSQLYTEIAEKDIFECLIQYPQLAIDWIQYSEDKRTSAGWFIVKGSDGLFNVGYYPRDTKMTAPYVSDSLFEACSIFIKREWDDLMV